MPWPDARNGPAGRPPQRPAQSRTNTVTYGSATVTWLADWRQARAAGQWWGAYRMHTWDLAERSRWAS
jgi:hypothetical protein